MGAWTALQAIRGGSERDPRRRVWSGQPAGHVRRRDTDLARVAWARPVLRALVARGARAWIAFGEEVGSPLRGGRGRVVRPSRGRLRDDVPGHAARNGVPAERIAPTRRRGAGRRSPSMTWRSRPRTRGGLLMSRRGVAAVAAAGGAGGASEVAEARPGRVEGCDSSMSSSAMAGGSPPSGSCSQPGLGCRRCLPGSRGDLSRSPAGRLFVGPAQEIPASGPTHSRLDRLRRLVLRRSRIDGRGSRSRRTATARRSTRPRTAGACRRRTRSARSRLPGAPLPRPRRRADPGDPHLPVRDDPGHALRHRPPSGVRQRVARRGWVRPRLQARPRSAVRDPAPRRTRGRGDETRFRIDRSRTPPPRAPAPAA